MDGKTVAQSRVQVSRLMMPEHANPLGNVHGGEIMKMVDEIGGLAAMRHARCPSVTVAMDAMTFLEPVRIGNLLTLSAELTYVGRSSMEVRVSVIAENPLTGEQVHTNWAYLVYVAIDQNSRPQAVPPLIVETEEEQLRMERAKERQAYRLRQREQEMPGK
jgi:acyl-CoA hydrolase